MSQKSDLGKKVREIITRTFETRKLIDESLRLQEQNIIFADIKGTEKNHYCKYSENFLEKTISKKCFQFAGKLTVKYSKHMN